MTLYFSISRNPANNHTLFHTPIVMSDFVALGGVGPAHEVLTALHKEGISTEEIERMKSELEGTGQTVLHSNLVTADNLQKVVAGYSG